MQYKNLLLKDAHVLQVKLPFHANKNVCLARSNICNFLHKHLKITIQTWYNRLSFSTHGCYRKYPL